MFAKLFIILFFILPPGLSFAADPKSEDLKSHLLSNPKDSGALYNLALNEQKVGNLALSLALAERSSFLNPLNFGSIKLKRLATDKLRTSNNEQIEGIPLQYQMIDFVPYLFLLALSSFLFLYFAYMLGLMRHQESITFKSQPKMRLHSGLSAAALTISVFLLFFKAQSQSEPWACVVSEKASLFTGPNSEDHPQVSTLNPGDCTKVVLLKGDWIALDPSEKASGWTEKHQVLIVRGNKFDPVFKSD